MLVNKDKKGEVYTLKLVSGEEVLAKVVEETADTIKLSKPLILTIQPTENGPVPAFAPLGMTYDLDLVTELEFRLEHVLYMFPTPSEYEKQYTSQTSGIQLAM